MKKILLAFCVTMFTVSTFADGIKISQGKSSYKKNEGKILVVFNWADAKWDNEKPIKEQWKEEYQTYVEKGEEKFIEGFNETSTKVKAVKSESEADYVMTVNITNVDEFFSVMSMVPGHKHRVTGEITVKDKKGEVICIYVADEFKGGRDFSILDSFTEAMQDLGAKIAKK